MKISCGGELVELEIVKGASRVGTAARRMVEELEKSKKATLSQFLGSICIKFLGRRQVEIIIDAAPKVGVRAQSLEDFLLLKAEDLVKLPGFGISVGKELKDTKAFAIVEGIKKARQTIKNLLDAGVVIEEPEEVVVVASGHPFAGVSMCFTGVRMTSDQKITFNRVGAVEKSGVSKNLNFLVVKDVNSTSNKMQKAKELGVQIISYDDFSERLGIV